MIIAMTVSQSGGRYDDRPWPGVGVAFEVTDEEGAGSVRGHCAVDLTGRVRREDLPAHLRLPGTEHVTAPAPVSLPSETAAGPADEPPAEPELPAEKTLVTPEPDVPDEVAADPPKPADPKADWVAYAVSQGADPAAAEALTKIDLMSKYGGRL